MLASCILLGLSGTASALPEGRVYEMVSPTYKGGYGANQVEAVAPSGEVVAFFSKGEFAGAPQLLPLTLDYVARRGESGWLTAPVLPPPALTPAGVINDVSSSLDSVVSLSSAGPNETAAESAIEAAFWLHRVDSVDTLANWELAGPPMKAVPGSTPAAFTEIYDGASPDLCHLMFGEVEEPLLPAALEAKRVSGLVYEFDRGCGGTLQTLRLIGLNNDESLLEPSCEVNVGLALYGGSRASAFNAIADGGKQVFFTTCVGANSGHHQLFVRLDGTRTLEISRPMSPACGEVPCGKAVERANGNFVGASENGSKVFFTSTAALDGREEVGIEEDTGKMELYMAEIGCPESNRECSVADKEVTSLVDVPEDQNAGEAAEVQGVVRIAPDGSHIYFVAQGVLGEGVNAEGQGPVKGADNLYVYDSRSGRTSFISELCSGPGLSGAVQHGAVEDLRCSVNLDEEPESSLNDTRLWLSSDAAEAQTAGADGRYLVFSSYAQLVGDDTDTAKDVYRYDAESGLLARISIGEAGNDADGNCDDHGGEAVCNAVIMPGHWGRSVRNQHEMDNRAASEDGSRIVFETAEPLSPNAINGLGNVYEWSEGTDQGTGSVSLVSSGNATESVSDAVISPVGNDIFFVTTGGLVRQDGDGAPDIYDARLHGGFAESPTSREPCSGDACQGPLTNPAPLLVPGSVSQAPGGNLTASVSKPAMKKTKAKTKKTHKPRRRHPRHPGKAGRSSGRRAR